MNNIQYSNTKKNDLWINCSIFLIVLCLGFMSGIIYGLEEPIWVVKRSIFISILFWSVLLFSARILYLKKGDSKSARIGWFFLMSILVALTIILYRPRFDAEKWKSSINRDYRFGENFAHEEGQMVEDIVKGELLIGKNRKEVEALLGTNHFTPSHAKENFIFYYYVNGMLDGCDQLWIEFENEICINTGLAGCD